MNILHVIDMISQEKAGGSAKVPYYLAREQVRLGHKVTIFASDYQAETQEPPEGVELVKFKCWLNLLGGIRITPGMLVADFKQFDVVHLHNYLTLVNLIAVFKSKRCILQAHGSCLSVNKGKIKPLLELWGRLIIKRCKYYITDAGLEVIQYVWAGANPFNIRTVPVGIDMVEFKRLPSRQPCDKKVVLYLGRLHQAKGIELLMQAFADLNRDDVELWIAGTDDGYGKVISELIELMYLQNKVKLLGSLYGKEKIQAYVDADVFIMPSRYEMWGLTFMEALACGTPVIMTDKCEASWVLPGYCGMVVPFDKVKMAEAIDTVLDTEVVGKFFKERRAWVNQYDWANIVKGIMKVYEMVDRA